MSTIIPLLNKIYFLKKKDNYQQNDFVYKRWQYLSQNTILAEYFLVD